MSDNENVWAQEKTANDYLEGTRAAIPLAQEQIRLILKIIHESGVKVSNILDVGCGDGILGRTILQKYPNASLTLSDLSKNMIDAAKAKIKSMKIENEVHYLVGDMADSLWNLDVKQYAPYDVIVSGLAIHHLTHYRKKQIYAEIYDLLSPTGIFLNLERVESRSALGERLNAENYIDSLYDFHRKRDKSVVRKEIAQKYFYRPLKQSNILAPVELQVEWLRELGYKNVDIFFKVFEIAIFGGTKRPLDA